MFLDPDRDRVRLRFGEALTEEVDVRGLVRCPIKHSSLGSKKQQAQANQGAAYFVEVVNLATASVATRL